MEGITMKGSKATKKRKPAHHTQWAAQFAVASELCKRDYQVALTMGNHPKADLMAISPKGVAFTVDVKGLRSKNTWLVRRKPKTDKLFYVLACVPKGQPNQFFVMSQATTNDLIRGDTAMSDILWKTCLPHLDKWEALPA
jgi:hypothetical protein